MLVKRKHKPSVTPRVRVTPPGTLTLREMSAEAAKDMRAQVLADIEGALKLPPGSFEMELSKARDPKIARAREQERLKRLERETRFFWRTEYRGAARQK